MEYTYEMEAKSGVLTEDGILLLSPNPEDTQLKFTQRLEGPEEQFQLAKAMTKGQDWG